MGKRARVDRYYLQNTVIQCDSAKLAERTGPGKLYFVGNPSRLLYGCPPCSEWILSRGWRGHVKGKSHQNLRVQYRDLVSDTLCTRFGGLDDVVALILAMCNWDDRLIFRK